MAVGSRRPRITLRGSKDSATLGAVATTWLMSLVTLEPLSTSRIGWLRLLHSTNTRSAWTRILPAGGVEFLAEPGAQEIDVDRAGQQPERHRRRQHRHDDD